MKKNKRNFSEIFNVIHVIFWLSIVFFGTVYLSLGILLVPALCSLFSIGKEVLYKEFDITDNIFRRFFTGIGENIRMMKYFPFVLIIALEAVGIKAAAAAGIQIIAYICPAITGFLLTFLIYLCLCRIYYKPDTDMISAFIIMICSLPHMFAIWVLMTLCVIFFGVVFMAVSILVGAAVMLLIQGVAAIDILLFRQKNGSLDEKEQKFIGMLRKR